MNARHAFYVFISVFLISRILGFGVLVFVVLVGLATQWRQSCSRVAQRIDRVDRMELDNELIDRR